MKTRNILIAVVFLVSLFCNAQSGIYTFQFNSYNNTVYTGNNIIVFKKGTIPSNFTINFFSYSSPSGPGSLTLNMFDAYTTNTLIATPDYTAHIGATITTFTVNNINNLHFWGKYDNQSGNNNWTLQIQYPVATGISNLTKQQDSGLSVYPNPSIDKVNIKLNLENDDKKVKIFLYSIMGQLVFEDEYMTNATEPHELNIEKLSKGIYPLQVLIDGKYKNQKIIKE